MAVTFTSLQALILCLNGYLLLSLFEHLEAECWYLLSDGEELRFCFVLFSKIYVYFRSSGHR